MIGFALPRRVFATSSLVALLLGIASLQSVTTSCGGEANVCTPAFDGAIPDVDAGAQCRFPCPVTTAAAGAAGDDYATFASGFFTTYCVRCHASTRPQNCFVASDPVCRNGAPAGYNWDDPASLRAHLAQIRAAVGVGDQITMPPDLPATPNPLKPAPTCNDRFRLIRWIDAGAPGLP